MEVSEVFEHYDDSHPLQGQQQHHCTDRGWFILLVLGVAGLVPAELYAFGKGDFGKFNHFWDYRGAMCGMGFGPNGTEDVLRKPYLYVCLGINRDGSVNNRSLFKQYDIMHPICVESCPTVPGGSDSFGLPVQYCPTKGAMRGLDLPPRGAEGEQQLFPQYSMNTAPLPADGLFICRNFQLEQHMGVAMKSQLARYYGWWQSFEHGLLLLLPSSLVATLVALCFVLLLDSCAALLGRVCAVLLVAVPLLLGAALLLEAGTTEGHPHLVLGIICVLLGIIFALMVRYMMANYDTAVGCIEAACECIHDEPSLFLAPAFAIVARAVTFLLIFPAVYWMSATGTVSGRPLYENEVALILMEMAVGLDLHAVRLTNFHYSLLQKAIVAYLGFMKVWLMETTHAMSQYALAYATQLWYFTPYEAGGERKVRLASCGILHGYASVFRYHMGTVSLAALLLTYLSMVKRIFGLLACGTGSETNPVVRCLAHCCCLCRVAFSQFLQFLSTVAYMDIAISSDNYFKAAPRATALMMEEGSAAAVLMGTQFFFSAVGMMLTCTLPAFLTYFLATSVDAFSNSKGAFYIPHPVVPVVLSLIPSLLIGSSFMLVLDTVADAVLYCFAVDEKYQSSRALQTKIQQRQQKEHEDEDEEEEYETFWEFLFGVEDEVRREVQAAVTAPLTVHYAPRRLQQLIEDHKHLVEES